MIFCFSTFASDFRLALAGLLLAAAPLAARAQQAGDLTGARPSASRPRMAAQQPRSTADAGLAKLIHQSVDLARATADDLPELYGHFIDAVREQRRQWAEPDWTDASETLGRLNDRYREVRQGISLEDRLRIRSWQGEFRTLQGARRVNQKLDEKNIK